MNFITDTLDQIRAMKLRKVQLNNAKANTLQYSSCSKVSTLE